MVALAAVAGLLLGGCGAPVQGSPVTITKVPYDLTRPADTATPTPDPGGMSRPYVYLVRDQVLVPVRSRTRQPTDPGAAVAGVLAQLTEGPSEGQRQAGLSTALGPGTAIRLTALEGGLARVDLAAGDQVPAASRVPLAVAQVVLSVTSVPGVDSVLVTRDGDAVELPLPGGALTASPVTAGDYASLVGSRRSPSPTTSLR
jgi:spore germination protein GerM